MGPFPPKPNHIIEYAGLALLNFVAADPTPGAHTVVSEKRRENNPTWREIIHERLPMFIVGAAGAFLFALFGLRGTSPGMMPLLSGCLIAAVILYLWCRLTKAILESESDVMSLVIPSAITTQVHRRWPKQVGLRLLVDMTMCDYTNSTITGPDALDAYSLLDSRDRYLGPLAPWLNSQPPVARKKPAKSYMRLLELVGENYPARANSLPRLLSEIEDVADEQSKRATRALAEVRFLLEVEVADIVSHALAAANLDILDIPDRI